MKSSKISTKTFINESGELIHQETFTDKLVNKLCKTNTIRSICLYYVWAIILYPCCKIMFKYTVFNKIPFSLKFIVYLVILIKVHEFSLFLYKKTYDYGNR
jgi:hypothetical protein